MKKAPTTDSNCRQPIIGKHVGSSRGAEYLGCSSLEVTARTRDSPAEMASDQHIDISL